MNAKLTALARRHLGSLGFGAALVITGLVFHAPLLAWFSGKSSPGAGAHPALQPQQPPDADLDAIDHYTCPMHPSVRQQLPGKCPICGMDLVGVSQRQEQAGVVSIDEARRQLIGVRTGPVIQAPMQSSIRAVGRVTYDEAALADVSLKVRGWVTELYVNQTGQRVTRGQPLLRLYSPELYGAEQDFLLAHAGRAPLGPGGAASGASAVPAEHMDALLRAARQRLHLLGLSDAQIDALAARGVPSESIELPAPASGFVIEKNVVSGAAVDAGMRLYRIADLKTVWIEADVYEADLANVHVGQSAEVTLDYLPGRSYSAKVGYLYPYLDPGARTGRVRLELANDRFELRPGMYANVQLASSARPRLQVPVSAIVYTGPRRLVFVDLGEGRFRPQEVRVGAEADGMYEVLSGLEAGERVATSGVFLIAAEARIRTAAQYWQKDAPEESHGAAPAPPSGGMQ